MNDFQLNNSVDKEKVFMVNLSDIEGRLDPLFYGFNVNKYNSGIFKSKTLNSICSDFKSGFGSGKNDQTDENLGIIQIRPTNIDNEGNIKFDKNIFVPFNEKADRIKKEDILFNNTNSQELVGKTALGKDAEGLYYSNHITKITVNKGYIYPEYLYILLNIYQQNKIFYSICTNWNNQSGVGIELLKSLKIPLPPKDIQKEIIERYEQATQTKQQKEAQAQQLLSSIDDYLLKELGIELPQKDNSLKNRIFTTSLSKISGGRFDPFYNNKINFIKNGKWKYPKTKLKELIVNSPQYGANEEAKLGDKNKDVRYIRITDIDEYGNLKFNDWKTAKNINKQYFLNFNDILFARSGSVGRCYIHKENNSKAIFAGYLIRFVLNKNRIIPDYFFYFCHSSIYKFWVSAIERPAVQSNINSKEYESLNIPLPPLEKQNEIAEHITQIREEAKKLQKEAKQELEQAKQEVEQMILGE